MLFGFEEDGTLHVVEDEAQANRDWEGIDVEEGAIQFYAEDGEPLAPFFAQPNRRRRLFWRLRTVESRPFKLQRLAGAGRDSFDAALGKAVALKPNPWFSSLEEVRRARRP